MDSVAPKQNGAVRVRREAMAIPTYRPAAPDKNPMFLENRVYQGSSGRVYPLPFIDRIAETPEPVEWDAITLENGLIEVLLLPQIGGRIHAAKDLTNGYDFIYRQSVIKPALVGLAGPWISGGVEFNWPQHHRPSTFMPTEVEIEKGEDGSITVWMSEHEPMDRMKGMHGICLHPGRNVVEIKARLYNRTPYTQTFLWWANIAARVHEGYQSFFPPDANVVADHAKRAVSRYPHADGHYYGVDYATRGREGVPPEERPADFLPAHSGGTGPLYSPDDLSWYANIPVPTSYMCMATDEDFFGGYDHLQGAGLLHVADRHISPGKKQWTWGNHEFGYAWDRNLTEVDGPYIELMAGVYTDNQPDFSWLAPGETKTFSQFLYPYQGIGVAHAANLDAAFHVSEGRIGVAVTRALSGVIEAESEGGNVWRAAVELAPNRPFLKDLVGVRSLRLLEDGAELLAYRIAELDTELPIPPTATEPPAPAEIASTDELYLTGLHLQQYRHATRSPVDYWREALDRDAGDERCNTALGWWHLRRGEFEDAATRFETAIARATLRNPNPANGESFYGLGLAKRFMEQWVAAEAAFGKAAWNAAWVAPAQHALAELGARRGDWPAVRKHIGLSLAKESENHRAIALGAIARQHLSNWSKEDERDLEAALARDPLDPWLRHLLGRSPKMDNGVRLDLAIDYARAGQYADALELLQTADTTAEDGTVPMVRYYVAWLKERMGEDATAEWKLAAESDPTYCFPARLEDLVVLGAAPEGDSLAPYLLGNWLYDRKRHREAIEAWQKAIALDPQNAIALRNLGIAAFNVEHDAEAARRYYAAAVAAEPFDARLLFEQDQLAKRLGDRPESRISTLETRRDLVSSRDDLTLEYVALLNSVGRFGDAEAILSGRQFQPWEGGEGVALGSHVRTQMALAKVAQSNGDFVAARQHLESALRPPESIGEARHLLANASDLWLALGDVEAELGESAAAEGWWRRAAEFRGDFQEMSVKVFSELTAFQAEALRRLGREEEASALLRNLRAYAEELAVTPAKIDYFATSLPTMLLFEDDLQARQANTAEFLLAQAAYGLGDSAEAHRRLQKVLSFDPNHALANGLAQTIAHNHNQDLVSGTKAAPARVG